MTLIFLTALAAQPQLLYVLYCRCLRVAQSQELCWRRRVDQHSGARDHALHVHRLRELGEQTVHGAKVTLALEHARASLEDQLLDHRHTNEQH